MFTSDTAVPVNAEVSGVSLQTVRTPARRFFLSVISILNEFRNEQKQIILFTLLQASGGEHSPNSELARVANEVRKLRADESKLRQENFALQVIRGSLTVCLYDKNILVFLGGNFIVEKLR